MSQTELPGYKRLLGATGSSHKALTVTGFIIPSCRRQPGAAVFSCVPSTSIHVCQGCTAARSACLQVLEHLSQQTAADAQPSSGNADQLYSQLVNLGLLRR
jgi:hypothetical protein